LRDVWPTSRILLHAEFHYSASDSESGFDPEFAGSATPRHPLHVRARNMAMTLALLDADQGIAPTEWQATRFPDLLRAKIAVAHEGIDTALICPSNETEIRSRRDGLVLRPGDEVVTYVARNLEPHRGFHVFMRALPTILAQRPMARAVIVGGEETSYGPPPGAGQSWKQVLLREVQGCLDLRRVHFLGRIPHNALIQVLRLSAAHVYLTYPFVLSWSLLDAMAAGALVIGSRTPPVEEIIDHGTNGILRDFFDVAGIAEAVVDALANPDRYRPLRVAARETIVRRFDLRAVCLPRWFDLMGV
jgi:glycosyltransferase involved in cell wall biosynthesis